MKTICRKMVVVTGDMYENSFVWIYIMFYKGQGL